MSLSILLAGDYPDDPRLGSSKVPHKLREEFESLGHTCDVVWSDEIGRWPSWRQVRQLVSPWMAARAIIRREGQRRYDIVDVASAEGLFIGVFNLIPDRDRAAFICRSHGLEHLNYARMLDDHHSGLQPKPWFRRLWYPASRLSQVAAAARLADALLVINDGDRGYAIERGWQPPDRVAVIPHGVTQRFVDDAPAADAPRGAGLLFCGTWIKMKGSSYIIDAMRQLHASGERIRLTILGPAIPSDSVLRQFDEAVRPFVTVIDRVPEDQVMREYRRHDALLFTSTYEGFGLVLLEAMSQRLPVIATPAGCAPALVIDGETGYRIPPRDASALAAAIRAVIGNPGEARRRAGNAHRQVQGMTWRATAEQTLALYEKTLDQVRHRPR